MFRWIGISIAIILLIAIGFIVAAAYFAVFREISRDIAIVVLAVLQMIMTLLLIVLLLAVLYTVKSLDRLARNTVMPNINDATTKVTEVLDQAREITVGARETTSTVSTTTTYVAEQVVSPFIRLSGLVVGVRTAARVLAQRGTGTDTNQTDYQ